jgi:prephenate dehydrogenase
MPDKIQITIVGLDQAGASAGLAFRRHAERVTVVGHDRNPDLTNNARKIGAIERAEWNLPAAVSGADRVILAVPVDEIRPALDAMADSLKPGCVILDMAEVKAPVIAWARELLPANVHFIGGHPLLIADGGAENADADLFRDRLFALAPDAQAGEQGVQLATDLVNALGAHPFYIDAHEHDALAALTEQAPALLAAALTNVAARGESWRDARRLAASQFYSGTLTAAPTGGAAASAAVVNRQPLLHWLDALIAELAALRQRVDGGDEAGMAAEFDRALASRAEWLSAYASGQWDEPIGGEIPTSGSMFRQMLGLGRLRKPEPPKR